jgi:ectoine hydroxylase-related dioxygenase (phytanoyl-CoA dioxygenase family)
LHGTQRGRACQRHGSAGTIEAVLSRKVRGIHKDPARRELALLLANALGFEGLGPSDIRYTPVGSGIARIDPLLPLTVTSSLMRRRDKASLQDAGFLVLPDVISSGRLERLSTAYDGALSKGGAPDLKTARDGSQVRLAQLVKYDTEFDNLLVLGPVLEACEAIIGQRFKMSGLRARTVFPGAAGQGLHVDVAVDQDDWPVVGFIVMLDAFRGENGATRFVPGSHKWAKRWRNATTNDRPNHDEEVAACGTAGSVIVFNGSTWHGFGANVTNAPRRSIQGHYVPPKGTCSTCWESLQPEILARLPAATRQILGIE